MGRRAWFVVAAGLAVVVGLSSCSSGCVSLFAPDSEVLDDPIVAQVRHSPDQPASFDHSSYDDLLADHVDYTAGRVDYAGLQADRDQLDAYLGRIGHADLAKLDADATMALLINAYNAYTLALILDHYPDIDSIKQLDSPWSSKTHLVGGHKLSLDDIEHGLLRPIYHDSRVHFAVNCASKGCPPLADFAYQGSRLDDQLERAVTRTLRDPRWARLDNGRLALTSLLNWYRPDFTGPDMTPRANTLPRYVARFSRPEVVEFIDAHGGDPAVKFLDYDWSLNDTVSQP